MSTNESHQCVAVCAEVISSPPTSTTQNRRKSFPIMNATPCSRKAVQFRRMPTLRLESSRAQPKPSKVSESFKKHVYETSKQLNALDNTKDCVLDPRRSTWLGYWDVVTGV